MQCCSFWEANLNDGEDILRQMLLSHIITARHAAPLMIERRRGLIVEVTERVFVIDGSGRIAYAEYVWPIRWRSPTMRRPSPRPGRWRRAPRGRS